MNLLSYSLLFVLGYPLLVNGLLGRVRGKARITFFGAPLLTFGSTILSYLSGTPLELGPVSFLGLRLDVLSGILVTVVLIIGIAVMNFTQRHLHDDPEQKSFQRNLALLLVFAILMLLSANLGQMFVSWFGTSFFLHQLLVHFPERTRAKIVAYQKFWTSRLGDVFLLISILMIYASFKTLDFKILNQLPDPTSTSMTMACVCFILGCAIKSAQYPFHSWLPNTMETPAPVSAIMHAGIINAGGYAVIRLSPFLSKSATTLNLLVAIGSVTVIFGTLSMLAQPTVKKSLAYSTITQMGFMFLQCGLGFFTAAVVHMIGHSFYKAHAFLNSGSAADLGRMRRYFPDVRNSTSLYRHLLFDAIAVSIILLLTYLSVFQWVHFPLFIILASTVLQIFRISRNVPQCLGLSFVIVATYFGLNYVASFLLRGVVADHLAGATYDATVSGIVCAFVFVALHVFQIHGQTLLRSTFGKKLYVKSLNGWA